MKYLLLYPLVFIFVFVFCTTNNGIVDNGGGTEITGFLLTSDAAAAENATVSLIDPLFKDTFTTTTDRNGKYVFTEEVPPGWYTFQGSKDSLACIIFNLRYDPPYYQQRVDTLRNTGWIFASASLESSYIRQGIEMYIPGTSFIGKSDSTGSIIFWFIPPGNYQIMFEHHGYISCSDSAYVFAGLTDTVGPCTLIRDLSVPVEIPVPTGLSASADTIFGTAILSWDTTTQAIQGYYVRIIDTLVDHYPGDGHIRFTKDASFTDTMFTENSMDTISGKFRIYQVSMVDVNSNRGQWGQPCSLFVKKPVVPPAPSCSLFSIPESLSVSVSTTLPDLWWIDSLIICRKIAADTSSYTFALPIKGNQCWNDRLNDIPCLHDDVISLTYTVYAKSKYGFLSQLSGTGTITIANPCNSYTIETTALPYGLPSETETGVYVVAVPSVNSPLPGDTTEYRLFISRNSDSSGFFTGWYTIPSIEVSLSSSDIWFLQSQVRSKAFPGLLSQLSDTCTVTVYKAHAVAKPSTPVGESRVIYANPCSYISTCDDSCTNGHKINIRYVVSYQGESASDSTSWLTAPDNSATIYWSKPGIAYLRAQARCTVNPGIVSPWSDALVVTVE